STSLLARSAPVSFSGDTPIRMNPTQSLPEPWIVKPLIFVVEDDTDIARLICLHLESAGFATRWFVNSANVVEEALKLKPALFLLDIMIPGTDGLELCRQIRMNKPLSGVHVIFLTAKASESDRVRGLELGGDDYITKPFSPRELLARVRAVMRSAEDIAPNE